MTSWKRRRGGRFSRRQLDLTKFTSATKNPDGTEVPSWLAKRALSSLATKGRIGLQGKHADAAIFFRNVRIQELKAE